MLNKTLQTCPQCTYINKHGEKCDRRCLVSKDEPNPICKKHQARKNSNRQCTKITVTP